MQRGTNRQPRADRGGRGQNRSRGRGRGGFSSPSYAGSSPRVPTTNQAIPGAHVSIVLKIDQGSGREVQGTIKDVLTSGNHPRGIKVRLEDGRVGRVQRMVTEEVARSGSLGLSGLGRNGESFGENGEVLQQSEAGYSRRDRGYRDIRRDDDVDRPPASYGLEDFLPQDHPLRRAEANFEARYASPSQELTTTEATCPVCNDFAGDEAAVAHHVNSHFD